MTMPPAYEQYPSGAGDQSQRLNPLAVVSLIMSILPLYLVGVITGHIALSQIKRTGERGHGVALAGVILGYIGIVVVSMVGILSAIAIPIFLSQQSGARDAAVQSDIINAKIAVVSHIIAEPNSPFPTLADLTEFVPAADTKLTLSGDAMGFCIEGYSLANGETAIHYAASDMSAAVEGTCDEGRLVPAN